VGVLIRPWWHIGLSYFSWLRRVNVGAVIKNLGAGASFDNSASDLPTEQVLGVSYAHFLSGDSLLFELDSHAPKGFDPYVTLGAEYWLRGVMAFRAGYRTSDLSDQGLRLGAGFRFRTVQVDYAWAGHGQDLGGAHRVSLTFRFSPQQTFMSPGLATDLFTYYMQQGQKHMDVERYDKAVLDFHQALRIKPNDDFAMHLLLQCGQKMGK
jgi:hypothetical protein